jgi:hypothetical protein
MTKDTEALIDSLAQGATPVKPMASPARLLAGLGALLVVYLAGTGCFLGLRADIAAQLHRPFYVAELAMLILIAASSLASAIYLAFPDQYQHPFAGRLPLLCLAGFLLLLGAQVFLPSDPRMVIPLKAESHTMSCTVCIGFISLIPSALMFVMLKAGASARPMLSGTSVVLAAAAIGCLVIRLEEMNDSLAHLALWHYLPALVFAVIGAFLGKIFLRW